MPDATKLSELLRQRVIVADGAIGSLLHARGLASSGLPGPALNLLRPHAVREIHTSYLESGARLIETNSYAAGPIALSPFGMEAQSDDICTAAARVAREAADAFSAKHPAAGPILVAGSIGPAGRGPEPLEPEESSRIYAAQASALTAGGVDLILLETFSDIDDLVTAVTAIAQACPGLPMIAQMAFTLSGTTAGGVTPKRMIERLRDLPVAGVGANCGGGEAAAVAVADELLALTDLPVGVFPNRGLARIDEQGRPQYLASPEYFAEHGRRLADMGVAIIGGCCGTTPDDIALLSARVGDRPPGRATPSQRRTAVLAPAGAAYSVANLPPVPEFPPPKRASTVLEMLNDRVVVLAEVDPPRGTDCARQMRGAYRLLEAGADSITVADNPLSVLRMSNLSLAARLIAEQGANITLHVSCRDRNLIGNQSHLMGASSLGITNVLVITGDPVATQAYKGSSGVFDMSSAGFIRLVSQMNSGEYSPGGGAPISPGFCIGTAFNSGVRSLENEAKRVARKVTAGAHYIMTQPVFDTETAGQILDLLAPLNVPVFIGIQPLVSGSNAEFLHNEVPGISIPEHVRKRMEGWSGDAGIDRGREIAQELVAEIVPRTRCIYLVPSFDRYSVIAGLCAFAKTLKPAIK